jgi:hypothetical protein
MLAAIAVFLVVQTPLPENASVEFSGIPQVSGGKLIFVSHSATLELYKDYAWVTSTSQYHNEGGAGSVSITIPRGRLGQPNSGAPSMPITATWVNAPLNLAAGPPASMQNGRITMFSNSLRGSGSLKAGGSYALRVSYRVPLGRAGFDRKQLLAAYDLTSSAAIGTLNVTYRYAKGVVFRLPEPRPEIGWQVGDRGAFVRIPSYDGGSDLSYLLFYPGGFGNIGG